MGCYLTWQVYQPVHAFNYTQVAKYIPSLPHWGLVCTSQPANQIGEFGLTQQLGLKHCCQPKNRAMHG